MSASILHTAAALAGPALPPQCTLAGVDHVECSGSVMHEPDCTAHNVDDLCCLPLLEERFRQLQAYKAARPFATLSFKCDGIFGGGDAPWASLLAERMANMTDLHQLHLDLSTNTLAGDALVEVAASALSASPSLRTVSLALEGSNISDAGATRLGKLLSSAPRIGALELNLRRNGDPDDHDQPYGAEGAGALTSSLSRMASLTNLTLRFGYDVELRYAGIVAVAKALTPLRHSLTALRLGFGFTTIKEQQGSDSSLACLGRALGSFTALRTLDLDLDCAVSDPNGVMSLGVHLACLPIAEMSLPAFTKEADCHCGLVVDRPRQCLIPNSNYPQLGDACLHCLPDANATACEG